MIILTIAYWLFIVAIAIFSFLLLIGSMAEWRNRSRDSGPSFKGYGPKDEEEKVPQVAAFDIGSLNHFLFSSMSGIMPGGTRTSLPLLPRESMEFLSKPYKEWAPEPYKNLPGVALPFGGQMPESPPPMIRFMHILGGMDQLFENAMAQVQPVTWGRSFKVLYTKVWYGVAPMSEAQWPSKRLDEQDNIEEALAIIQQVVDVWKFMVKPATQGDIRHVHNKLWAEIDVLNDALVARASSRGEGPLPWNITALWHEYIKCHFAHMQTQSRSWTYTHLKTLHHIWKARFLEVMQSGRQISETHGTIKIDHYAMMILNKIQELQLDADIFMRQRLEGFVTADRRIDERLSNIEAPKATLNAAYAGIFAEMEGKMRGVLRQMMAERKVLRLREMPTPDFLEPPAVMIDQEFCHRTISYELENPNAREVEGWVREQLEEKVEGFGFVVYRLCYGQSDKEWEVLKEKIEEGIYSGWEGVLDGSKARQKARLHWIDGREEVIAEGDMDGARKDFQTISPLDSFPTYLSKGVCLAVTPSSILSYNTDPLPTGTDIPSLFSDTTSSDTKIQPYITGDFRPYLHVIDGNFALPSSESEAASTSSVVPPTAKKQAPRKYPEGYTGTFPITDQLVWSDLFGMHTCGMHISLDDMWSLGSAHPWGVYVGPTTGVRRREWREMKEGMGILLEKKKGGCVQS